MCEITSKFKLMINAACAVGDLGLEPPKRYRNWRKETICREAISSFQLFVLDWTACRAEQGENEANPIIAFGLQDEMNEMIEFLKDVADGRTEGEKGKFKAVFIFMWKLWSIKDHNTTPEKYFEMEEAHPASAWWLRSPKLTPIEHYEIEKER